MDTDAELSCLHLPSGNANSQPPCMRTAPQRQQPGISLAYCTAQSIHCFAEVSQHLFKYSCLLKSFRSRRKAHNCYPESYSHLRWSLGGIRVLLLLASLSWSVILHFPIIAHFIRLCHFIEPSFSFPDMVCKTQDLNAVSTYLFSCPVIMVAAVRILAKGDGQP